MFHSIPLVTLRESEGFVYTTAGVLFKRS